MFTEYAVHNLTPEQVANVPAGPHTMLNAEQVLPAIEAGERVYAYMPPVDGQRHGQLTRLASAYYVEKYAERIAFAWASGTTVADMIGRA
ncbi:MAG: hypothetical protein K0S70_145 [Microbacterium sp.]|jgi:hypothetical protein|nr:hypothetical protein [Microbacterium sp.]